MGLFSRSNSEDDAISDPFDPVPLPDASDLDETFLADDNFNPTDISPTAVPTKKLSYGIEDAISLMRGLPQGNKELVVTVVKKTLESTQIALEDIIGDAKGKEERLHERTQLLQTEIKKLQTDIEQRNKEIASLQTDLEETLNVREKLELAQKLDIQNTRTKADISAKSATEAQPGKPAEAPATNVKTTASTSAKPKERAEERIEELLEKKPEPPEQKGPLH